MKSSIVWLSAMATLAWPLASLAQTEHPLTREEVVQELIQVEQAGYRPGWEDATQYPDNILAAEARVAAKRAAAVPASGAAQPGDGGAAAAGQQ